MSQMGRRQQAMVSRRRQVREERMLDSMRREKKIRCNQLPSGDGKPKGKATGSTCGVERTVSQKEGDRLEEGLL